ncbi:MAG TPA: type II toxin-antitoxin system prevent-host-death family antitoxin, partial [Marmoricola sp.]|nr:type II toxin-antitoxin system prevent-host-death family antitoxin [Marmoricola sp.]
PSNHLVHGCTLMYMTVITVSEARRTLPHQIDLVQRGEEIEISRYGEVVARLVPVRRPRNPAAAEAMRRADELAEKLAEAREAKRPLRGIKVPTGWADDLVGEIRADRDSR